MDKLNFKKLDYTIKTANKDAENGYTEEVKKSEGILPTRAHITDAGLDLYSTRITQETDNSGKMILVYHTDIAVEIPDGYVGLMFMKSSVSRRSVYACNAVGVIDSGYRGELMAKYKVSTDAIPTIYQAGEAFAQLLIVPLELPTPMFVDELTETDRADGGFGSTENINKQNN